MNIHHTNLTSSWKKKKVGKIGRAQLREDSHLKQRLHFARQTIALFDTWDNDEVIGTYVITMIIKEIIYNEKHIDNSQVILKIRM